MTNPHWSKPGSRVEPAKPKPPRDYVADAIRAVGAAVPTTATQQPQLISAVIIAQALDRLGERLVDAAAVSQYKRTP